MFKQGKLGFRYVNIYRLTRVLIGVYEMLSDEFFLQYKLLAFIGEKMAKIPIFARKMGII